MRSRRVGGSTDQAVKGDTMIDRYDPFARTMGLRQVMDRLLEDAVVMPRSGGPQGSPSVDVYEEGDTLVIEAQVPGFTPDNLDVNVENGVLTISGQTEAEEERKERNYLLREKRSARFTRSLHLPPSCAPDPTEAIFEHGVLRLVFPKTDQAKPRRIHIGGNGQQAITNGQQKTTAGGS
jgi:HSP20 family protein